MRGWTFSHSRSWVKVCQLWPDALKQQRFLPKSKGCRLFVYSTTEVQINHNSITYLQRSPEKNPLRTWSATLTACSKPNSVPDKKSVIYTQNKFVVFQLPLGVWVVQEVFLGNTDLLNLPVRCQPARVGSFFSTAQLPAYIPWGLVW